MDKRIEMGTGQGSENGNQNDEDRPRRDGVAKQGNGGVSARQLGGHDARTNHSCEKEGGAQGFSGELVHRKGQFLAWPI